MKSFSLTDYLRKWDEGFWVENISIVSHLKADSINEFEINYCYKDVQLSLK